MNLESPLAGTLDQSIDIEQHHSMLGDFGGGLGSHLKAPLAGVSQLITGKTFDDSARGKTPAPESKARTAGEMVGDAIIFLGVTAILKRVPACGALAPMAAGGVLGLIEPLKNGDGLEQRLVHGAVGIGTMAMIDRGPKFLAATGLIKSAETSMVGAFLSGAIIGGATEQVNSFARTGHLATLSQTATGALSFGLTSGAFHGVGNVLSDRAKVYGERSRAQDATSLMPSLPKLSSIFGLTEAAGRTNKGWHLVLGSGGSKSALTGAGVVLATRAADIELDTIGGVSGGMIPATLAASGMPSHELLRVAKQTDIATLLTQRPLFQQVRQGRKLDLLKDGLYDTAPLGEMVHSHVPNGEWPDKLWTMAVGGEHSEVVFTKKGVTEYTPNGQHILSSKPAKISEAVRATSAIPGMLASMEMYGKRLYDGALGKFGKCPSDMAKTHFGVPEERIIASLPVGAMTTANKKLYQFAKYLSGNMEQGSERLVEHAGIVIRPEVKSFHSLRFSLQPAQREEAIMAGYRSALEEFAKNNLIKGARLDQARAAGQSISALEQFFAPKPTFNLFPTELLRLTGPKPKPVT
jgi:predicted acylesterase/phospholipase RssA